MSEVDAIRTDVSAAANRAVQEAEPQLPPSGPQPFRPTTQVRTVARPQPPIRRPEVETRPRFGRTVNALKTMIPLLQRALPLLEGNVASAVAGLLLPMPGSSTNLEPVEQALRGVHAEIEVLRSGHGEQTAALRRLDNQLADLRDAADRQSARQLELADEVHLLRKRLTTLAALVLLLLGVSVGVSIFLLLKMGAFIH